MKTMAWRNDNELKRNRKTANELIDTLGQAEFRLILLCSGIWVRERSEFDLCFDKLILNP